MSLRNHPSFTERNIASKLVRHLLSLDYQLGVNDGEETTLEITRHADKVFEYMATTDEDYLIVWHQVTTTLEGGATDTSWQRKGWVRLIYGNGEDLISDFSVTLEDDLAPIEREIYGE